MVKLGIVGAVCLMMMMMMTNDVEGWSNKYTKIYDPQAAGTKNYTNFSTGPNVG